MSKKCLKSYFLYLASCFYKLPPPLRPCHILIVADGLVYFVGVFFIKPKGFA